jgi:hypothetical protein
MSSVTFAYIYSREARRIAVNVARLPQLLADTENVRARLGKRHTDAIKTPPTRFRLYTSCFGRFPQLQPRPGAGLFASSR